MAATVLVVDDEETARMVISEFLRSKGYEVLEAGTLTDARAVISKGVADIIILDVRLPDGYGPHLLTETSRLPLRPQVIIVTAHGEVSMAVEAMKNGAQDFMENLSICLNLKISQCAAEVIFMRRELAHFRSNKDNLDEFIVGDTPQMNHILELAGLPRSLQFQS